MVLGKIDSFFQKDIRRSIKSKLSKECQVLPLIKVLVKRAIDTVSKRENAYY